MLPKKQNQSNLSIGFPDIGRVSSLDSLNPNDNEQKSNERVNLFNDSIESYFGDTIACVILCEKHKMMVMTKITDKGEWLPVVAVEPNESWKKSVINLLTIILNTNENASNPTYTDPEIVHILRVQVPQKCNFVTRIVFKTVIKSSVTCCQSTATNKFKWKKIEEVSQSTGLWGPEPLILIKSVLIGKYLKNTEEFDLNDAKFYLPRDSPLNKEEVMLKTAMYKEHDIIKIYNDFIHHCHPSQYMSMASFTVYMRKISFKNNEEGLKSLFRAFNFHYRSSNFLRFHELLLGLAAMDHATAHGGYSGELRCGYIFRYYDSDEDGNLIYDDMLRMIYDMNKEKGINPRPNEVENRAKEVINQFGKNRDKMNYAHFLKMIGGLSFRGTSVLFRSSVPILQQISLHLCYPQQYTTASSAIAANRRYNNICPKCKLIKYQLISLSPKMDVTGKISAEHNKDLSDSEDNKDVNFASDGSSSQAIRLAYSIIEKILLIDVHVNKRYGPPKAPIDIESLKMWFYPNKEAQLNSIKTLCQYAESIFTQEERVVNVPAPCYIIGDIHGNLRDLITFSRTLWRTSPLLTTNHYLFLGDYVDRGDCGVECVAYLFALKIVAPKKFFLCRGNHEIRSLQKMFTFHTECMNRFNESIWECFNKTFDRMPIAAVVDDSIFCAHGGIPTDAIDAIDVIKLENLKNIPTPLTDPENQSSFAWEILWNDPINSDEYNDLISFMKLDPNKTNGFLSNTKRGTAHFYSEDAVNNFLKANDLDHVIRAHEVMDHGYKFHAKGKVITIFSCSRYCGMNNSAACVFVDQQKLRIIRVET